MTAGERVRPRWFAKNETMLLVVLALLRMTIANESADSDGEQAGVPARQLNALDGFGWGLVSADESVIKTFYDVTLRDCILECSARPRCKGLEYKTTHKYCKLVSGEPQREKRAGYFSLTESETSNPRPSDSCNDTCEGNEACTMSAISGQMECQIQECGHPSKADPVLGNRYQRNSRLLVRRDTGDLQLATCTGNGTWEYGQPYPYPGVTCGDIRRYGRDVTSGVYLNKLNISVYCEFEGDMDWLVGVDNVKTVKVFQRRRDGSVNFSLPWADYRDGFGNLSGEFWLGLEPLYRILTSTDGVSYTLQIDLKDWYDVNYTATYDQFSIANETYNYTLSISGFNGTGTLNDTFSVCNGNSFSTLDKDNDNSSDTNCAKEFAGGWWYTACVDATLNGEYFPQGTSSREGAGIIWKPWTSGNDTLRSTTMKIRRNAE